MAGIRKGSVVNGISLLLKGCIVEHNRDISPTCICIEPNSLDVDQAQHDDETSLRYRRDLVLDELDALIGIDDALQVVIRTITHNPPLQPLPNCTAGNIVASVTIAPPDWKSHAANAQARTLC